MQTSAQSDQEKSRSGRLVEYGITASEADLRERLIALIKKLEGLAGRKLHDADRHALEEERGRRLLEHGAACYFNAAQALRKELGLPARILDEALLRQPNLPADLSLEQFPQGSESPGR